MINWKIIKSESPIQMAPIIYRAPEGRASQLPQDKFNKRSHIRPEHVEADLDATLKDLQTNYVDSFVIHWPMACPSTGKNVTLRTNGIYPAHHLESMKIRILDIEFSFGSAIVCSQQIRCFLLTTKGSTLTMRILIT